MWWGDTGKCKVVQCAPGYSSVAVQVSVTLLGWLNRHNLTRHKTVSYNLLKCRIYVVYFCFMECTSWMQSFREVRRTSSRFQDRCRSVFLASCILSVFYSRFQPLGQMTWLCCVRWIHSTKWHAFRRVLWDACIRLWFSLAIQIKHIDDAKQTPSTDFRHWGAKPRNIAIAIYLCVTFR